MFVISFIFATKFCLSVSIFLGKSKFSGTILLSNAFLRKCVLTYVASVGNA